MKRFSSMVLWHNNGMTKTYPAIKEEIKSCNYRMGE